MIAATIVMTRFAHAHNTARRAIAPRPTSAASEWRVAPSNRLCDINGCPWNDELESVLVLHVICIEAPYRSYRTSHCSQDRSGEGYVAEHLGNARMHDQLRVVRHGPCHESYLG